MKVAIFLAVVACATAQFTIAPKPQCTDNFFVCTFRDLGNQIKSTVSNIGSALKEVGSNILNQAASKAKDFAQLATAALGKTLSNAVADLPVPSIGRRSLKEAEQKAQAVIDQVMGKVKAGYHKAVDGLMDVAHRLGSLQLGSGDIHMDIQDIVDEFEHLAKQGDMVTRRSIFEDFGNQLASWKNSIGDFLKPHVDNVVAGVKSLGNTLKGHATNLVDTLKGHAATLGDKLKEHAGTLQGHAQTALQQLQSAVSDILKQAVPNVAGTISDAASDLVSTGSDAAVDAAGVVSGAVGDLSSQAAAAAAGSF